MAEQASWYVVHTYSGYENKVAQDLMTMVENRRIQDLICDVKVPTETVLEEVLDKGFYVYNADRTKTPVDAL